MIYELIGQKYQCMKRQALKLSLTRDSNLLIAGQSRDALYQVSNPLIVEMACSQLAVDCIANIVECIANRNGAEI